MALKINLKNKLRVSSCAVRGPAGESAYEIAVRNGYTGTEVEWLASLKGDKGDTGPVKTVNSQSPDSNGDVSIVAENVPYNSSSAIYSDQPANVDDALDAIEGILGAGRTLINTVTYDAVGNSWSSVYTFSQLKAKIAEGYWPICKVSGHAMSPEGTLYLPLQRTAEDWIGFGITQEWHNQGSQDLEYVRAMLWINDDDMITWRFEET